MTTPVSDKTPFHAGELQVQERLGVKETIGPWAQKVIRPFMPEEHRTFYTQLPFVVAAGKDRQERPWVTLLTGEPGFIQSPSPTSLTLTTRITKGDALEASLHKGSELGLLGIELDSRRRNRVNGKIVSNTREGLNFEVSQSFGNCPQYITPRQWHNVNVPALESKATRHSTLSPSMQRWIRKADTFFIGSGHSDDKNMEANGLDASHRGGPEGFVRVETPTRLVFPDYSGNNHFNTLGNLVTNPKVALLFVDFEQGSLLQLTGTATIDWGSPAVKQHAGAQRLVLIDIEEIVELPGAVPLRFSDPSKNKKELTLVKKQRESRDVTSFYFAATNESELDDFKAGQHLTIELNVDELTEPVTRSYSLSDSPKKDYYRISVKREPQGLVSRFLHDSFQVGSTLNSTPPAGDFGLGDHNRPIVFISGGIGVTPLLSMLHELTRTPSNRRITFVHSARDGQHHAMAEEIRDISHEHTNVSTSVTYSQPLPTDQQGERYDHKGRITQRVLETLITNNDSDFFLCGSPSFLHAINTALNEIGVNEKNISIEEF